MEHTGKIPLVCVVGPTASGKTALAVELALAFSGEVVSADSMQIYRGLDIGTAKPTFQERKGVPHHLMDFLPCESSFSVAQFLDLARQTIQQIHNRGCLPILAGGTGLYVSSLVDNVDFQPIVSAIRISISLEEEYDQNGPEALVALLREKDPESVARIHPNNRGRIVRAVEVLQLTGAPISEHQRRSRLHPSPYRLCMLGLKTENRDYLYQRINARVDQMMESGLLEEAYKLYQMPISVTASQAIGYKELFGYFRREYSLEEAVYTYIYYAPLCQKAIDLVSQRF